MAKRRYKVVGSQPILDGKLPGETFEADLPEDQEAFLKQIGAIRSVGGAPAKNPERAVEKAAEQLAEEQEAAKRPADATD